MTHAERTTRGNTACPPARMEESWRPPTWGSASEQHILSTREDFDAQLVWQVSARCEELLEDVWAGRPAAPALRSLLGYLREVLLTRIADEEQRLISAPTLEGDSVRSELRRDHLQLREDVEDLAQALGDGTAVRLEKLDPIVDRLVRRLDQHVRVEAHALTGKPPAAGHAGTWADAMRWYPEVEGLSIDMDDAACDEGQQAVLSRLLRLQEGEGVELHGHGDAQDLRQSLVSHGAGTYKWTRLAGSPSSGWVVRLERSVP